MAGSALTNPINEYLNPANADLYREAQAVVANAASSRDAVEGLRATDGTVRGASAGAVDAARDVLGALPRALDGALLAAVRSGLARSIAIHVEWDENTEIGVRITEDLHQGAPRVRIVISHPHDGR